MIRLPWRGLYLFLMSRGHSDAMERTIGLLFSGFAMRLYGAIAALWIASEAIAIIRATLESVSNAF